MKITNNQSQFVSHKLVVTKKKKNSCNKKSMKVGVLELFLESQKSYSDFHWVLKKKKYSTMNLDYNIR